jgi:hypothetical protein
VNLSSSIGVLFTMHNPIDELVHTIDRMNPVPLILGGLFTFCALGIGYIVWRHGAARDVWSEFAGAHGLEVSGLEVGGTPRVAGRYRGVEIEVGLNLIGTVVLRRRGSYEISDTRIIARLGAPLPEGTWLDAESGVAAHPLVSDPVAGPVVDAFMRDTRQAAISDTVVTATIEAMPADVAALERVVDACVRCAQAIDARTEARPAQVG